MTNRSPNNLLAEVEGFLEHAVSENIIAGPAMSRRARYQFGLTLPRGAEGEVWDGIRNHQAA